MATGIDNPLKAPIIIDPDLPLPEGAAFRLGGLPWRCRKSPSQVSVSSDGKWVAVGGNEEIVHLGELATAKPLGTLDPGRYCVTALRFHPHLPYLAAGTYEGPVLLWDINTRERVAAFRRFRGHVTTLRWGEHARLLLIGREDGEVVAWDVQRNRMAYKLYLVHYCLERTISVSPCTQYAAVYDVCSWRQPSQRANICSASVWEVGSGRVLWRRWLPFEWAKCAAGQAGQMLYVIAHESSATTNDLWAFDMATGEKELLLAGLPRFVTAMVLSPCGKRLALGSDHGDVLIVELSSGRLVEIASLGRNIELLEWSGDGAHLVCATLECVLRVLPAKSTGLIPEVVGHSGPISFLGWGRPSGPLITASATDHTIRFWDLATRCEQWRLRVGAGDRYAVSPSGRHIAVQDSSGLRLLEAAPNGRQVKFPYGSYEWPYFVFAGNDTSVILVSRKKARACLIAVNGTRGFECREQALGRPKDSAASSDEAPTAAALVGGELWVAYQDGYIGVYDASTLEFRDFQACTDERNACVRVSRIVADHQERRVALKVPKGVLVVELPERRVVRALPFEGRPVDFSPNGRLLLMCGREQTAVWDLEQDRIVAQFGGHPGEVTCAMFSPDGRLIVTGGSEGLIIGWDLDRLLGAAAT
jgi:WD40 repeat protein